MVVSAAVTILLLLSTHAAHGQSIDSLGQIKRIYVGSFGKKPGSVELRKALVNQLRKAGFVTVLKDAENADAVLKGNGEIWVKGYYSLNPRSGRLPSEGKAVLDGFLSVELKNKNGGTLWSYMVSPKFPSSSIVRELSKEIVRQLSEALRTGAREQGIAHPITDAWHPLRLPEKQSTRRAEDKSISEI